MGNELNVNVSRALVFGKVDYLAMIIGSYVDRK